MVKAPAEGRGRRAIRRAVCAIAIVYLAVALFPGGYFVPEAGLDPSWVYAINWLAESPYRFGRDVNFTYGPLGFLLFPENVGHHIAWAASFRVLCSILSCLVLALLRPGAPGIAVFALVYTVGYWLGNSLEMQLLIVVALWTVLALRRQSVALLASIGAIAAPLALVKFSLEPGTLTIVLLGALLLGRATGSVAHAVALALAAHLASFFVCAALALSPANIASWLRASIEIASGYSSAMSFDPGWTDHLHGALIGACLAILASVLFFAKSSAWIPLVLLGGPLFLAFKAGYVRQDGHVAIFYGFATAASSVAVLVAERAMPLAIGCVGSALIAWLCMSGLSRRDLLRSESFYGFVTGRIGYGHLRQTLQWASLERSLPRPREMPIPADTLPEREIRAIGQGRVSVIPWELSTCAANAIACQPIPTLQTYCAYTPYLDGLLADFYRSPSAPAWLIVHGIGSIDERHLLLDDPRAALALLERYRPALAPATRGEPLLLAARSRGAHLFSRQVGTGVARLGEWTRIPDVHGVVLGALDFSLTTRGRIARLLYRIYPVYLELRIGNSVARHRILPETSGGGLLLSGLPLTLAEMEGLLRGVQPAKAREFRIVGKGTAAYRADVPVRFVEVDIATLAPGPSNSP